MFPYVIFILYIFFIFWHFRICHFYIFSFPPRQWLHQNSTHGEDYRDAWARWSPLWSATKGLELRQVPQRQALYGPKLMIMMLINCRSWSDLLSIAPGSECSKNEKDIVNEMINWMLRVALVDIATWSQEIGALFLLELGWPALHELHGPCTGRVPIAQIGSKNKPTK